jgi:uncharacterized protein (TIGR00369 family)
MFNPTGSARGGITTTLLDSCLGSQCTSPCPPAPATRRPTDIHVRCLCPMTADTGSVLAVGEDIRTGRRQAVAEARLVTGAEEQLIRDGRLHRARPSASAPRAPPPPIARARMQALTDVRLRPTYRHSTPRRVRPTVRLSFGAETPAKGVAVGRSGGGRSIRRRSDVLSSGAQRDPPPSVFGGQV